MFSLLLHLCTVHGFFRKAYDMIEGGLFVATFSLNVKGETTLQGALTGRITSEAGGTACKLMHYSVCIMYGMFQ